MKLAASNVTQHQASLTILKSQITNFDFFARTAVTGTSSFQASQYVGTVYGNLSGDVLCSIWSCGWTDTVTCYSKITSGTFVDERIQKVMSPNIRLLYHWHCYSTCSGSIPDARVHAVM